MTKTTKKPSKESKAVKKTTVKQLKIQKSGPLPSAGEDKAPKRKRQVDDSDSPTDEDESTQKLLDKSSFDSSSKSDPSQSPPWDPVFAEQLDGRELSYEVSASSRAGDTASVATPKKEALCTIIVPSSNPMPYLT